MPSPDLAAIDARAAAATEGPWEVTADHSKTVLCVSTMGDDGSWASDLTVLTDEHSHYQADAAFIAHARTDVPALIARIRELEAENAKIDDLDEALRQRDREILGLRRDRDALTAVRTLAAGVKLRMVASGGVETQRHRGAVDFAEEVLGAISGKPR